MKDGIYTTKLYFTKLSPPALHGLIPRIGKRKILEKLSKLGISENDLEETDNAYYVWLGKDLLLEIIKK